MTAIETPATIQTATEDLFYPFPVERIQALVAILRRKGIIGSHGNCVRQDLPINVQESSDRDFREPVAVDILSEIPGVEFDAAWERRVEEVIDQGTGTTANFISRDDLIAAKLASGRLQDLADVDAIYKAAHRR